MTTTPPRVMRGYCPSCGHPVEDHFRRPSCACGCNLDPMCMTCTDLASRHEDDGRCVR